MADINFPLGESPYRREVKKVKSERSEFEICNINERVISRLPFNKKYLYVHLKEEESGNTYWDILLVKSGEPEHFTLGKEDEE
ncbi:hypothetical protein [Natronomonas sp. LN261]|uniref:hypothetical protein n=1 Tax=Natronomonas sp. LN261 TaxID=2750669 RepID=UPI0015EF37B6|nr:hypothetical protein [Natronomonas sp. LN261]